MEICGGGDEEEPVFPFWAAARRRFKADDPFFDAGNIERELLAKQVALDLTEDERDQFQNVIDADILNIREQLGALGESRSDAGEFAREQIPSKQLLRSPNHERESWLGTVFCPIVGCGVQLNCLEDFEDHYHARHTASCSVCYRVFPTSRLLSIHVSEAHDSFFQAKVARGFPMYECLVEGCGVKLKSYKSRQQHLVDKHRFPKSFEFFKKSRPSKRQRQKNLHRQAVGYQRDESKETDMNCEETTPKHGHQRFQPKQAICGESKDTEMDVEEKTPKHMHQRYQPKQAVNRERKETEMNVGDRMDDLVSAVSKLSTSDSTPSSVSFGHRHARGFAFVPRSARRSGKLAAQPDAKD